MPHQVNSLLDSDALCQAPSMEASLPTWALLPGTKPSSHGQPSPCLGSKPCTGVSRPLLTSPGHLLCSVPPSDFRTTLVREEGRGKERRRGEGFCTWFCCVYCTRVCDFATLVFLRGFFLKRVTQRILETTLLPLF